MCGGVEWVGGFVRSANAHLSDDEAVAKMGHPVRILTMRGEADETKSVEDGAHCLIVVQCDCAGLRMAGNGSAVG
jgi:hypothetical protein